MNKVLVYWLMLLLSLPLVLSCGREGQLSLSSLQKQAIRWANQRMKQPHLSTCMDSAYWIGICWNLYQLSKDSVFRIEAEGYVNSMPAIYEDTNFNAAKAFRAFMAFGKGFDATGTSQYRHKVWDLADRLLADTVCINSFTVEAMLWGTAHKGCHCFEEGAVNWGDCLLESTAPSINTLQTMGVLYAYTSDTIYKDAFRKMNQSCLLDTKAIDSLRLASIYARMDSLLPEKDFGDEAFVILKKHPLHEFSFWQDGYYFTETLLRLSTHK